MARLESVASGGYFPTPQHLIPLIREHLEVAGGEFSTVDPCAGDGAAIAELASFSAGRIYTCEMEAQRHAALVERMGKGSWWSRQYALHGDAFRLEVSKAGVGLLLLNPPYDLDPVHGRLEQRFLERFTPALTEGGVLVFIVPHYALAASAETLATEYDDISCFRFPAEDFEAFKQVVVFAKKCDARLAPDPVILRRVNGWAKSVAKSRVIGTGTERWEIPRSSLLTWKLRDIDLKTLLRKVKPWRETRAKGVAGGLGCVAHILPEVPVADLLFRTFPLATAPRPAHISAGIASGLFNGREVSSTTPGMPRLLVKGVFDREYVTIEEKKNKDGETTSVVQVQQPKLVTTVLDLETKKYTTLKLAGEAKPDATTIDEMGIEGLLSHYGPSLMQVMKLQCPVIYDPERDAASMPLAPVVRPLFKAQENASKALLSLLGGPGLTRLQRRSKAAILLGEIGVGKTSTALAVANTVGKRTLAMCPPHLLADWTDEARSVVPDVEIRVLKTVSDVDALVGVSEDKPLVAILSRETAKLGHAWTAVNGAGCPKCGAPLPKGDLAKKRICCEATQLECLNDLAKDAFALALKVAPSAPGNSTVGALLEGNALRGRWLAAMTGAESPKAWPGFDSSWVEKTLDHALEAYDNGSSEDVAKLIGRLVLADYQPARIAAAVRKLATRSDYYAKEVARDLTMMLPLGSKLQNELKASGIFEQSGWQSFDTYEKVVTGSGNKGRVGHIVWKDGQLTLEGRKPDSLELATFILAKLGVCGHFRRTAECGEPLFQATARPLNMGEPAFAGDDEDEASGPRRFALSKYIARRYPDLFDFMILDEGHEYNNADSAQSHAAHRLTALGIPTILMTGSIMNGYAESLFTNMWALSADFRAEFKREELQLYIDRYGYRKRILSDRDKETGEVVEFGAVSDRVQRNSRVAGDAPGLLPLFLFRHLLKFSVTLHKADLALDLPPCVHIKKLVEPSPTLLKNFKSLQNALIRQIRQDQFSTEGLAGKLFGQLAELPSYLDRATSDTGNQDDGSYAIHYPQSVGGKLVARVEPLPASTITPKEQWMLDTVRAELAEGRNVMVFGWHVSLLPRLSRLLESEFDTKVPILYADKVPTGKRRDWIQNNIIAKGRRIMVANPVAISTGLNNLVHFCTEIWMEDPACNPITFRQACGRVDRVGQKKETRIYSPTYEQTLQVQLFELLMRKVAVSIATDGLDNESALLAAGASNDAQLMGMSIGKQLYAMINGTAVQSRRAAA